MSKLIDALVACGYTRGQDIRLRGVFKVVVVDGHYWVIQNVTFERVMIYKYSAAGDFLDHESQEITTQTWARVFHP